MHHPTEAPHLAAAAPGQRRRHAAGRVHPGPAGGGGGPFLAGPTCRRASGPGRATAALRGPTPVWPPRPCARSAAWGAGQGEQLRAQQEGGKGAAAEGEWRRGGCEWGHSAGLEDAAFWAAPCGTCMHARAFPTPFLPPGPQGEPGAGGGLPGLRLGRAAHGRRAPPEHAAGQQVRALGGAVYAGFRGWGYQAWSLGPGVSHVWMWVPVC